MGGNLHKLSAGDGYTYLTKQVAVMDSTELGTASLGDYYSMKGEAPGRWLGSGLAAFDNIGVGDIVTESQMKSLYGHGRHPNAEAIEAARIAELVPIYFQRNRARGMTSRTAAARAAERAATEALKHTQLGAPFRVYDQSSDFRRAVAAAFSDYNVERGRKWNTPVPQQVRARIRTDLARAMFTDEYRRPPVDERELSSWIARNSRQRTQACAGYDWTLFPEDKSISVLWALADVSVAKVIERCHLDAAAYTVTWFEDNAVFTRTGANGVAQVDVTGVVATLFTHRDSRAGDPYLHSHVAISNKVQTLDGRWLALDGRTIHKYAVWASEVYNTRIETLLRQRLGLRFVDRPHRDDPGKRGTRAVIGIPESLSLLWSARDNAIQQRRAELVRAHRDTYGREPSPREAYDLAQRASLDTRQRKHRPRSEAEQRASWWAEAVEHLGSEAAVNQMQRAALNPEPADTPARALTRAQVRAWIEVAAEEVVERVSSDRATWQINHVGAEAERIVRAADLDPDLVEDTVAAVIAAALDPIRSVGLAAPDRFDEPEVLRRRDGTSVYVVAGSDSYTSAPILAAEQRILDAAARRDGRRTTETEVGIALVEYHANNPRKPLNPGQIALVREFATSAARVQVALAPAGTGKTTTMKVFTTAWCDSGGTVVGLAPTAAAAAVLREEIGVTCDTIDKLLDVLRFAEYAATAGIDTRVPDWVAGIGAHTMIVIDEAALASTAQLDEVIAFVLSRGGSVRMICDDKQLAAISAGGIVRAIAESHGAVTLDRVIRFRDEHGNPRHDEAAASLALRESDPAAIGFYLDHARVHAGDPTVNADDAYRAWAADQDAGLNSVMMAPTHDITRELNTRARTDRLTRDGPTGPETVLRDRTTVSAGDIVRTTRNRRRLRVSDTDWVRNGTRWHVERVHPDGALTVRALHSGLSVRLPADYVATEVILGYAATIMTSQGITADTGHTVLTGTETRNDLYMALTRGIRANHAYFPTALTGDEHSVLTDAAMNPTTAVDMFTRILTRDGTPESATTHTRHLHNPHTRLGPAVDAYTHALATTAQSLLTTEQLTHIDHAAQSLHPGLTDTPAWPTLRGHLAVVALSGTDPVTALTDAYRHRELNSAHDIAAVLDWRLDTTGTHSSGTGPLPWLTGIPTSLDRNPGFGPYLRARAELITELTDQITTSARGWDGAGAPLWARPLVGAPAGLLGELAVWRAATAVPDIDRAPTGPPRYPIRERRHQKRLDTRVAAVLASPHRAAARWRPLAHRLEPRLLDDSFWPVLADGLTTLQHAGHDAATLAETALAVRPLPDEHPASALWWRLTPHLTDTIAPVPAWIDTLRRLLGDDLTDELVTAPAWPRLRAAVTDAQPRWDAGHLIELAVATLREDFADEPGSLTDPATALTDRVRTLTVTPDDTDHGGGPHLDEPPLDPEHLPPDPAVEPAPAGHGEPAPVATSDSSVEEDYLAAVAAGPEPDTFEEPFAEPAFDPIVTTPTPGLADWNPPPPTAPIPVPYPGLPAAERVVRLRTDLDAARRRATDLWATYLARTGPSRRASAPMRRALRRADDHQNPHRVAATDAHQHWVTADRAATEATTAHTDALAAAETARDTGDESTASLLDLQAALLGIEAATARDTADTLETAAEHARHARHEHTDHPTSHRNADTADTVADDLDLAEVRAAHDEVELLEGQLLRAENTATHPPGGTDTETESDDQPLTLPRAPVATVPRTRRRVREDLAEIAQRLRTHRLQMLTATALATEIHTLREQLRHARTERSPSPPTSAADRVRRAHHRLHHQADAITAALRADTTATDLADRLRTARTALTEHTHTHQAGGHSDLDGAIADARAAVADLHSRHADAEHLAQQARDAATALDAQPEHWDAIRTRAGDTDALARELAEALDADAAHGELDRETHARITELADALHDALDERQRREDLDDDTREDEDRVRADQGPLHQPHRPSPRRPTQSRRRRDLPHVNRTRRRGPGI